MIVNGSQNRIFGFTLDLSDSDTNQYTAGICLLTGQQKKKKQVMSEMIVLHWNWLTLTLKGTAA